MHLTQWPWFHPCSLHSLPCIQTHCFCCSTASRARSQSCKSPVRSCLLSCWLKTQPQSRLLEGPGSSVPHVLPHGLTWAWPYAAGPSPPGSSCAAPAPAAASETPALESGTDGQEGENCSYYACYSVFLYFWSFFNVYKIPELSTQ